MANIINFSHNWNAKLFGRCFTTIRLANNYKYQVGTCYQIQLNGKDIGLGNIIDIKIFKLEQLNTFMAAIDTGYNLPTCKEIILTVYKNKNIDWSTQLLMYILIEQPDKDRMPAPDILFGTNQHSTPAQPTPAPARPQTLFSKV